MCTDSYNTVTGCVSEGVVVVVVVMMVVGEEIPRGDLGDWANVVIFLGEMRDWGEPSCTVGVVGVGEVAGVIFLGGGTVGGVVGVGVGEATTEVLGEVTSGPCDDFGDTLRKEAIGNIVAQRTRLTSGLSTMSESLVVATLALSKQLSSLLLLSSWLVLLVCSGFGSVSLSLTPFSLTTLAFISAL